tara:strand:- start:929 stop:1249 length:321 start_codon:yes stop_codon:yes gene_type:complete
MTKIVKLRKEYQYLNDMLYVDIILGGNLIADEAECRSVTKIFFDTVDAHAWLQKFEILSDDVSFRRFQHNYDTKCESIYISHDQEDVIKVSCLAHNVTDMVFEIAE